LEVAEGEDEGDSIWGPVGVGVEVPRGGLFVLVAKVGCGPVRPG
jgi:hypothetical protein